MIILKIIILFAVCNSVGNALKKPTIFISILVRNKAHVLPYFLSNIENLDYPKERITLRYVLQSVKENRLCYYCD